MITGRAINILDTIDAEQVVKFVEMREDGCILVARIPNNNLGAWEEASLRDRMFFTGTNTMRQTLLQKGSAITRVLPEATSTSLGGWLD